MIMPLSRIARAAVLAACLAPVPLVAQPVPPGLTDPAALDRAIAAFAGQPIGAPGGAARPVDRRLRLSACSVPPALGWRGEDRASILVECPDPGGWHIYVAMLAATRQAAAGSLIERGQQVTIALSGDGFSVSQPAEALEAGAAGAWIKVRTAAKAEPVQAQVIRPGLVSVPVE